MYKLCTYLIAALFIPILTSDAENEWDYTLQSLDCNTTNANLIDASLRAIRTAPGIYGIKGSIDLRKDLDKSFFAEVKVFRSPKGDSQYTMSPYQIPKSAFNQFMNKYYKTFLMNEFKECSNLPTFEIYTGPLPTKKYAFNSCVINSDSMPTHLPLGWYKLIFVLTGLDVELVCQLIANVFKKT